MMFVWVMHLTHFWPLFPFYTPHFRPLFPFLYPPSHPLKTPEDPRFFGVFRGYKMGIMARNGFKQNTFCAHQLFNLTVFERCLHKIYVLAYLISVPDEMERVFSLTRQFKRTEIKTLIKISETGMLLFTKIVKVNCG